MRKQLTLSLLSLSVASMAVAQHKVKQNPFGNRNMNPIVKTILERQISSKNAAAKPTNSGERLIGYSVNMAGVVEDSAILKWSGNRSTPHVANPAQLINTGYSDPFYTVVNNPVYGNERYPLQKADSTWGFYDDNGTIQLWHASAKTYGANDVMLTDNVYFSDYQRNITTYTYNQAGKILTASKMSDTSSAQTGTLVPDTYMQSKYDGTGKLIEDSVSNILYNNILMAKYFYDANGKDTAVHTYFYDQFTSGFVLIQRYVMTYSPTGMLVTSKYYYVPQGNTQPINVDSFAYTGTNAYPTFYRYTSYDMSGMPSYYSDEYAVLNSNGDIQQLMMMEYDANGSGSYDTTYRYTATYNSSKNPTILIMDQYALGSGMWINGVGNAKFYYEPTPTGITQVKKAVALDLYPNPATDAVTINTTSNEPATISVTDVQGRLVQRYTIRNNSIKLDMKNLSAGTYLVTYETASTIGTAKIQKQ